LPYSKNIVLPTDDTLCCKIVIITSWTKSKFLVLSCHEKLLWYGFKGLRLVANKTKCSEPTICLRNICKDVTLIPLYLINYSISANISILTWRQLISIIDCIGIWKTRFHSSNNTKELVLKVRCAVKVHRAGTCFHYMVQPLPSFKVSTWKRQKTLERALRFRHSIGLCQRDNFSRTTGCPLAWSRSTSIKIFLEETKQSWMLMWQKWFQSSTNQCEICDFMTNRVLDLRKCHPCINFKIT